MESSLAISSNTALMSTCSLTRLWKRHGDDGLWFVLCVPGKREEGGGAEEKERPSRPLESRCIVPTKWRQMIVRKDSDCRGYDHALSSVKVAV